jgi:hypothetical protein
MKKLIFVLLVGLSSVGCGTMKFDRGGYYTQADFYRDWSECEAMNRYGGFAARGYQERCMVGRGWTRTE